MLSLRAQHAHHLLNSTIILRTDFNSLELEIMQCVCAESAVFCENQTTNNSRCKYFN